MNDRLQLEETVFDAARQFNDRGEREAYLEQACAGDPSLRARIESLLEVRQEAERFFAEGRTALSSAVLCPDGSPPGQAGKEPPAREPHRDEREGTSIGRYKLLEKIGEGGCGVVYMAEQKEPVRRRVALKVIKLGMDTRRVIARFEAERQALAMMDHTNIARVLDAGATDIGRPYFVMELVRGVKITEYCDENQLDTRQRLHLFILVCHAIQHAHQKGIIHRDIKPSNILVTLHDGVPVPKVIDFGIAKATEGHLTDKTLFTGYEQLVGTPAYMSPEQVEFSGLDIDTRTDIYSLGVLLYELLTGKTPFDPKELLKSGLDEMRRTLRERDPFRPSTMITTLQSDELSLTARHRHAEPPRLISLLKGDLDWVVMKALEKDRRRRYATANGLAMDIQRYLDNEAVAARPPSRVYRFQKLVRRNQGLFIAIAAVAAVLIAGLSTSTWLFLKEREARQRAVASEQQQARLRHEAETREKITQASLLVNQERFDEADTLLSRISLDRPTVEGAAVFRSVGEWHALQQRWKVAAERLAVLLKINQLDGWDVSTLDYLSLGPTLIELQDTNGYERFRRQAIARFTGTPCPVADRIVKISLLLPADKTILESVSPLADVTAKSLAAADASGDLFQAAWRSVSLALLEYRRDNYSGAVDWCHRCLAYAEYNAPRTATARVILAMSYQQLGRSEEAQSELAKSREIIQNKFKRGLDRGTPVQGFWFDWVFARILLREATAKLSAP